MRDEFPKQDFNSMNKSPSTTESQAPEDGEEV
jgi:hypothetical protein